VYPQQCVDFLVERVGFERENAIGEVRRSFQGGYGPLHQAAYLLGGLQIRALRRKIVDSGQMSEKAFHDEILRHGAMPISLLRLALGRQKLTRDTSADWKSYGDIASGKVASFASDAADDGSDAKDPALQDTGPHVTAGAPRPTAPR
jgi:hypothetical protein